MKSAAGAERGAMGSYRCVFCEREFEDARQLVPMLLGPGLTLACRSCVRDARRSVRSSTWNDLVERQHLARMGWLFGESDARSGGEEAESEIEAVDLNDCWIDPDVSALIPPEFALRHRLIPISKLGDELLVVMAHPDDAGARARVRQITGLQLRVAYAPEPDVLGAIEREYGPPPSRHRSDEVDVRPLLPGVKDDVVVNLANLILSELIRSPATEVHVERNERRVQVLYRIDGLLESAMQPPVRLGRRLMDCFRLLAGLRATRSRRPQVGTIHLTTRRGRVCVLQVSFHPHASGENVVVRRTGK